jgi:hypothetical protein
MVKPKEEKTHISIMLDLDLGIPWDFSMGPAKVILMFMALDQ